MEQFKGNTVLLLDNGEISMAYNPNFPVGYQSYYPNTYNTYPTLSSVSPTQPTQNSSGIIWIQGEAGAKSYMVAPNNTVALWDSESQTVYLKSADASGMPSMKVLDYTIREDASGNYKKESKIDFATKDDVSAIQRQIDEIKANMSRRKENRNERTLSAVKSTARE